MSSEAFKGQPFLNLPQGTASSYAFQGQPWAGDPLSVFTATAAGIQELQTGAATAILSFVNAGAGQQLTQSGSSSATLVFTASAADTQLIQQGAVAASVTFVASAAWTQLVQTGLATAILDFIEAEAGVQALQVGQAVASTTGIAPHATSSDLYTGDYRRIPVVLLPYEAEAAAAQAIQGGSAAGEVQTVISGAVSASQDHQTLQGSCFQEDEAELLALLIALAA